MTPRKQAWTLHVICLVILGATVAVWSAGLIRQDRGGWHVGEAVATILIAGAVLYGCVATLAVGAWGRRPRTVLLIHLASLVLAALAMFATCTRG